MKITLESNFDRFEKELAELLVGKTIKVTDAPRDMTNQLDEHEGVVKSIYANTATYDYGGVTQINFEDGAYIYVLPATPIEIL